MASRIKELWKLALKTFCGCKSSNYKMCLQNFEKLRSIVNEIKAEDVYIDKKVLDYVNNQPAPMCVISVFENQDITIAIFILKPGETLPLHNHPEMHGFLKVISGMVKIDSYSIESQIDKVLDHNKKITAIKDSSNIIKHTDPACVLTPFLRNLHEITCLEGPAAFLDVLSPPYDNGNYDERTRRCTFFKVVTVNEKSNNVQLIPTIVPPSFYSTSLRYKGQPLR